MTSNSEDEHQSRQPKWTTAVSTPEANESPVPHSGAALAASHQPSSSISVDPYGLTTHDTPLLPPQLYSNHHASSSPRAEQAPFETLSTPATSAHSPILETTSLGGSPTSATIQVEFGALRSNSLRGDLSGTIYSPFTSLYSQVGLPASNTPEAVRPSLQKNAIQASTNADASFSAASVSIGFSSSSSTKYKTFSNRSTSHTIDARTVIGDNTMYGDKLLPTYNYGFQDGPEDDDELHTPDPKWIASSSDALGSIFTIRGLMNVGTLVTLASGLLMLFAGYPVLVYVVGQGEGKKGGYNLGGSNATGQVPALKGLPSLIDQDTPREAYERMNFDGSKRMNLVFSDEFNKNGRSFYPGDDPFWEAVDLHYWGTGNYEWYDPAAITTEGGNLVITLSETPDHGLNFRGGMMTTWNKMCFTGGYIEVRVVLPGSHDISGLWPAAWTMGNLGRAGYGATTDGMWPYTYDECDVGTLANQTWPANMGGGPLAAATTGVYVDQYGPGLSYLPGQRLSRCTCPDFDDHPGPKHSDGSFVGRSAPEIDIIEAQANGQRGGRGHVSMSMQLAPYDSGYNLTTTKGAYDFFDPDAILNSYTGSVYQQAASGIIATEDDNYEDTGKVFDTYGFEYKPGSSADSYVTWTKGNKAMWRLHPSALGPNPATEIGQRQIPPEPMYVILNLGLSSNFAFVDFDHLRFPAKYYVDYVRIWQPEDEQNLGCDPPDFPTQDYINKHWVAYNNANLTIWEGSADVGGFGQRFPPNRLVDTC